MRDNQIEVTVRKILYFLGLKLTLPIYINSICWHAGAHAQCEILLLENESAGTVKVTQQTKVAAKTLKQLKSFRNCLKRL